MNALIPYINSYTKGGEEEHSSTFGPIRLLTAHIPSLVPVCCALAVDGGRSGNGGNRGYPIHPGSAA